MSPATAVFVTIGSNDHPLEDVIEEIEPLDVEDSSDVELESVNRLERDLSLDEDREAISSLTPDELSVKRRVRVSEKFRAAAKDLSMEHLFLRGI